MSFKTDVATMTQAASNVDSINGQVQGELTRVQGIVEEVAASWKGQAQAAFQGLMERWNVSAKELNDALMSISENIRANAMAFDDAELTNASAFQQ